MGRFIIALGALLVAGVAMAVSAHAETFPSRSIRIIVPYAPGGSIDLTARVIAKNLQDSVRQSVIVENKPGANAAIGIDDLMRSEPDGYTLIILSDSPVTINVHFIRVNYDPLADLVPIGKVVSSPLILTANAKAGIASIADLVKAAKAKPLSYGVAGRGSSSYLAGELLQRQLGLTMQPVTYRGGAPAAAAVASGEVPLAFTDTAAVLPLISSGPNFRLGRGRAGSRDVHAQHSDAARGRRSRFQRDVVACDVRPARHAGRPRRQAQCRDRQDFGDAASTSGAERRGPRARSRQSERDAPHYRRRL